MNLPTFRQLQYFVAVFELRHFGKAADRCFVSQSTLSAGLAELEGLLGVVLIERNKRNVLPTASGHIFYGKTRKILALSQQMVEEVNHDKDGLQGSLVLGTIPTVAPFLLPLVLPELQRQFPQLSLSLIESQSENLIKRLKTGELDVAILALPYDIGNLEFAPFWQENFLLALTNEHNLSAYIKISSDQLPIDELLILEEGHCLSDHALSVCHLSKRQSKIKFQGTSIYTLLQMVSSGQGLTFVPELILRSDVFKAKNIKYLLLDEPGPHRTLALVWRKSYPRKNALSLLKNSLKLILQKE